MTSPGRSGPCPCGSGRPFKDCCATGKEARQAAVATTSIRDSAISKLLTFAFQPVFDADHSAAESVFWGDLLRKSPGELRWLLDSEDATTKYHSWFLFDWEINGAGTAADLFLEEMAHRLPAAERRVLERLTRAHLRLYEVQAVNPRRGGIHLTDLWTGDRLFVTERPARVQVVTWDLLAGRVAPEGQRGHTFEGGLYLYPAMFKEQIVSRLRTAHRRHERKHPGGDLARFFRMHGMLFHHLWLELVAFPDPPQVMTADGDPLMFCRAVFDTAHADRVREAIGSHPDVRTAEDGRFAWCETSGGEVREVGRWAVEEQRVLFETVSQARAARGRAWLEALVGRLVRYRATELEAVEQTMKALRQVRPSPRLDPAIGDRQALVRELFDRQYHTWLDRPDPALGNRTPRAAAQTRTWRPRLVERLKQMENGAERAALAGRPAYDFRWMWTELGLER